MLVQPLAARRAGTVWMQPILMRWKRCRRVESQLLENPINRRFFLQASRTSLANSETFSLLTRALGR